MIRRIIGRPSDRHISLLSRVWSGSQGATAKHSEQKLAETLRTKFPDAKTLQVTDISGGCGAMFEITIEAQAFRGISKVKQHRMVTDTLKDEIKDMHGLRIHTSVPNSN